MNLLQKIANFYHAASNKKDYKKVLQEISKLETFKDRVDLAEKEFDHLSSGSSRVIYKLPDNLVLKLAKNDRGVAQNKAEANPQMKSKYINKTILHDPKFAWKISPYLDKLTEKEFNKLTGVNFKNFGEALDYGLKSLDNASAKKPKNFEEIKKADIYKELVELGKKFELLPGDMSRISSWGVSNKTPVLLDAGLTRDIYDEYYTSAEKKSTEQSNNSSD